jgi:molecular chaperone GrpE
MAVGNIIDNPTFANNLLDMKKKNMPEKEELQPENEISVDINTDDSINGSTLLNNPVAEESEVENLQNQVSELNDKFLRQVAEFDNFRRRNAREKIELIQTAGKEVIKDLLEVLDDCERAQKGIESTDDNQQLKEGVQLIFSKLFKILSTKGLKPMESMSQDFNPDLHEAISEIEAGEEMKGKVVAEVQKGYYLNDKIIRFAKVVVGK